jgi:Fic family protein
VPGKGLFATSPKWLVFFLDCLGRAIAKAKTLAAAVLEKDAFWRHLKEASIEVSERQKNIINMLLDGFEGKLTTEKWGKLAKTSHDTALREIQDLIEKRILKQDKAGGRSTAYVLLRERDT